MIELSERERQTQSLHVIRNTIDMLETASRRTGWNIGQLVDYAREGHRSLTEPVAGHDYRPFDAGHAPAQGLVTVELPDLRLWERATRNLRL